MSPKGIERIDRPPREREFDGKLMPMDVFLSDAMATSAAAVDHHMGAVEGDDAVFKDLKVILGVAMGTAIVADLRHEEKRNCCIQVKTNALLLRGSERNPVDIIQAPVVQKPINTNPRLNTILHVKNTE